MNRIFVYGAIGLVIGEIVGSPIVHHEYDHSHQEWLPAALPNNSSRCLPRLARCEVSTTLGTCHRAFDA